MSLSNDFYKKDEKQLAKNDWKLNKIWYNIIVKKDSKKPINNKKDLLNKIYN